MKTTAIALALSLTLAACGGGGGGTEPQQAPAPVVVPLPAKLVIVAAYGDSTMMGAGVNLTQAPPAIAQGILTSEVNSLAQVRNEGVSGTTSTQLLEGTDGAHQAWALSMAASPAHIVVVNHAINDVHLLTGAERYRQNLIDLTRTAKQAGKLVVLDTPNPIVNGGSLSGVVDPVVLAQFAQIMRDVAAQEGATLCDEDKAIRAAGLDTLARLPDGVHPDATLYAFKGKTLAACLAPLVL